MRTAKKENPPEPAAPVDFIIATALGLLAAMEAAVRRRLGDDLEIRMVTSPFFVATKLEAFKGRGKGDFFASHDLEDVVSVVDGRATLVAEIRAERPELRTYLRTEINTLLAIPTFLDGLPGYLLPDAVSQSRMSMVLQRCESSRLCELG